RPHGRHPCLELMVTTAFTIRDLHPIDSAHAGRTMQETSKLKGLLVLHENNMTNKILKAIRGRSA
ncbi:hypothetical protein, partial [Paenibacillus sp. Soil766]|uniref:hypothetical protein n=1 Tax=Paenibacillus sp. Soil766 TaxID=1736404 RepID=UPI001F273C77